MRTETLLRSLRKAKKDLFQFSKELPHTDDTFIYVDSLCLDVMNEINTLIKELPPAVREAKKDYKKKKK